MKYAPAIAMNALSEDFGGPEERAARRARRQARRAARKAKKLRKLQRQTQRARREAGIVTPKRRRPVPTAPASTALVATRAPSLQPAPRHLHDPDPIDADWEDVDPADATDEEMEGIGAFQPVRRMADRVRASIDARRAGRASRRTATAQAARPVPLATDVGWGPAVSLGRRLRIQARMGHRAAVIDLRPGLFLVAEIPEAVTRTEFGIAPLLAPLMVRAATQALNPEQASQQRRGPLAALFQRGQEAARGDKPLRLFRARSKEENAASAPHKAPLALPGPVASPPGGSFLLPAPNVGWADNATVAEVLGCEACEEGW